MIVQLRESKQLEKSLKEKIVKEKQRYSDLRRHFEELQNIQPADHPPGLLLKMSQQEEDKSLDKQEELQSSQLPVLDEETQTELTKLQLTMENVNISLEKVEVIMKYWSGKVTIVCMVIKIYSYVFTHSMFYKYLAVLLVYGCVCSLDFKGYTVTDQGSRRR